MVGKGDGSRNLHGMRAIGRGVFRLGGRFPRAPALGSRLHWRTEGRARSAFAARELDALGGKLNLAPMPSHCVADFSRKHQCAGTRPTVDIVPRLMGPGDISGTKRCRSGRFMRIQWEAPSEDLISMSARPFALGASRRAGRKHP